jgi:hypothetical protein
MIDGIPGWLNYFVLTTFYYGVFSLLRWLFEIEITNKDLFLLCSVWCGSYLSKYRQGGGGLKIFGRELK